MTQYRRINFWLGQHVQDIDHNYLNNKLNDEYIYDQTYKIQIFPKIVYSKSIKEHKEWVYKDEKCWLTITWKVILILNCNSLLVLVSWLSRINLQGFQNIYPFLLM